MYTNVKGTLKCKPNQK